MAWFLTDHGLVLVHSSGVGDHCSVQSQIKLILLFLWFFFKFTLNNRKPLNTQNSTEWTIRFASILTSWITETHLNSLTPMEIFAPVTESQELLGMIIKIWRFICISLNFKHSLQCCVINKVEIAIIWIPPVFCGIIIIWILSLMIFSQRNSRILSSLKPAYYSGILSICAAFLMDLTQKLW